MAEDDNYNYPIVYDPDEHAETHRSFMARLKEISGKMVQVTDPEKVLVFQDMHAMLTELKRDLAHNKMSNSEKESWEATRKIANALSNEIYQISPRQEGFDVTVNGQWVANFLSGRCFRTSGTHEVTATLTEMLEWKKEDFGYCYCQKCRERAVEATLQGKTIPWHEDWVAGLDK